MNEPRLRASTEGLPILYTSIQGSGQGCPRLRASDEHSFIVRVLRARRAPGRSPVSFFSRLLNRWVEEAKLQLLSAGQGNGVAFGKAGVAILARCAGGGVQHAIET